MQEDTMSTLEELQADAQDEAAQKLEEMFVLIAKVFAWHVGLTPEEIDSIAGNRIYMDDARQCAEDLGWA